MQFSGSLTGAEYGQDRVRFLNSLTGKMSETTELPTIREIEGLGMNYSVRWSLVDKLYHLQQML